MVVKTCNQSLLFYTCIFTDIIEITKINITHVYNISFIDRSEDIIILIITKYSMRNMYKMDCYLQITLLANIGCDRKLFQIFGVTASL